MDLALLEADAARARRAGLPRPPGVGVDGARRRRLRRDDEPPARAARGARVGRAVLDADGRDGARVARRHGEDALPHRGRPSGRGRADALPRRPALALPLLPVGLPAHVHVLRDRLDGVRAQPHRVGDPRPGAPLPAADRGRPLPCSWGWASRCSTSTRCSRRRGGCRTSASRTGGRRSRRSAGCRACGASSTRWTSRSASRCRSTRADDELRSRIMPVNERYPIADVVAECRRQAEATRRRVFVEYVMLAGVNDAPEQARALAELLGRDHFKVNLIPYNPTGPLRGLVARADRRLPARARARARARHRAPHARAGHRSGLRAARGCAAPSGAAT